MPAVVVASGSQSFLLAKWPNNGISKDSFGHVFAWRGGSRLREICVIQSCTYVHNAALTTGVQQINGF